jgi:hypothetical protein
MKSSLTAVAFGSLALVGCGEFSGSGVTSEFDALRPPGSGLGAAVGAAGMFAPGVFVETIVDGAAFFVQRPRGDADANKLLAAGTPMKVIQSDISYVKVELDSGEVGFVPANMVAERGSAADSLGNLPPLIDPVPSAGDPAAAPAGGVPAPPPLE